MSSGRKIRILHVDHAPVIGGAELSLLELIDTLDSRFESGVVCTDKCPQFVEMLKSTGADIHIATFPRMKGILGIAGFLNSVNELCSLIRQLRPDIVHSNTVRAHIASAIASRLCGVKVVWTMRDFTFPVRLYQQMVRIVDHVICISRAIQGTYGAGGTAGKSSLILNGIVPPALDAMVERARIRSEYGIPDDALLVSSVGQLLPWKGQTCFLEAAKLVRERIPQAWFMVVGEGTNKTYVQALRSFAEDEMLSGCVVFTGYRDDPISCMCASDAVVHTSLEPEAFGRVIIEAMAVGRPVIASPYGAPSEIIEDGVNGLLVTPKPTDGLAQAMERVLTDSDLAERLSQGGSTRFSECFDQRVETEAVQTVYEELD